jgi:ATP-binding cassette, subfamily B, bacterial MsbA
MKEYFRLLGYLKPYWLRLGLTVVAVMGFAALDGATMSLAIPLLAVLFGKEDTVGEVGEGAGVMPDPGGMISAVESKLNGLRELILSGGPQQALQRIVVLIIVLFVLKAVFDYCQRYLSRSLEQLVVRDLRNKIFNRLSELSLSFFQRNKAGQLISCMSHDVNNVRAVLTDSFSKILQSSGLIVVYLSMLLWLSWRLTLMAAVLIPPMALMVGWVARKLRRKNLWLQNAMGEITAVFQEAVSGIRVVKAFGMENFERKKFHGQTEGYYHQYMRTNRYASLSSPLTESLMSLAGGAFLLYGGRQVLEGGMGAEHFFVFMVVALRVMSPVKALSNFNDILQQGLSSCDRIFRILDSKPDVTDATDALPVNSFNSLIRYDNVSFSYLPDTPVLSDVSLEIHKGEAVAVVGPSGGGKSTLMDMLPRFYDVDGGGITLDGKDIRSYRVADLRALVGIVTQETILFNDTVRNNIAYGLADMPLEKIVEAAEAANAHEFIQTMDEGYDTVLGERGTRLSGGQRQRIAIARAILKNPDLLIFDEATSALDTESEHLVQQAIEHLMQGRTSLVIAHRLSTIQHCDRIVVMDRGRIVQCGTHDELMASDGLYSRLYNLQFQTVK